ncbi:MAG: hypothetical protein LH614_04605 [Pyrinomonadaceae bacterium]|nr:hypothetical protein [Pyrinomonadaceae bacterium]
MAHWNPWEKLDKQNFIKTLQRVKQAADTYSYYEVGTKYLIPKRVHANIMGLIGKINQCGDFCAYYRDAVALCEALQILEKPETKLSSATQARAFGNLFIALSAILVKIPVAKHYGETFKVLGENFEGIVNSFLPAGFNDPVYARIWANANDTRF